MAEVVYQVEPELTVDEFLDILERSTLAERRPVEQLETIRKMLAHADLIVTARIEGRLVGISRALTDYAFVTYLSDLGVDEAHQAQGIGRELIRRTHEAAGTGTQLVLLACLLYTSPSPRDGLLSRMPSSA